MIDRLKNVGWVFVGAIVLYWGVTTLVGTVFSGPLDPPAAPAPTQKTQITSLPFTAGLPGSYILMANLTCTGCAATSAITIGARDITIDLNGFTIRASGSSLDGIGISGNREGLTIKNGAVRGFDGDGIDLATCTRCVVENVEVFGNGAVGIKVGGSSIVRDVIVESNVDDGIQLIFADNLVADSLIRDNSTGIRVSGGGNEVRNNVVRFSDDHGIYVGGSNNRIEGNSSNANGGFGIIVIGSIGFPVFQNLVLENSMQGNSAQELYVIDSEDAVIVRNSATGNAGQFDFNGIDVTGPIESSSGALSNPWANIAHD